MPDEDAAAIERARGRCERRVDALGGRCGRDGAAMALRGVERGFASREL